MNKMEMTEFEFPDEKEAKQKAAPEADNEDFDLVVEDDTPEPDRNRAPLPKELVNELEADELEDYSEKVKIRLKQMKKVWHDERREKEQALREQQEAVKFAQKMLDENKTLRTKYLEGEKSYIDTYKTAAEMEMEMARRSYKEAYDAGDTDKLLAAQEQLNQVNFKLQRAKEYQPSLQIPESSVNSNSEVQVPRPDPKAAAWRERNTWFGQDEEMTSLALGLHQKLVKEHGDSYPSTNEYWNAVDATMKRRFPERFEATTSDADQRSAQRTEKPATVVASATRSTSSKKVTLKQSEIALAKKLGLTPEQYAREKQKMEARNG